MKKLLTLLVALCCLGSINAQLVDVIVETFGTSVGTYPAGHTTYRVFARLQGPTDFLSAVYGIGSAPADPDHELRILDNVLEPGTTTDWNSGFGGVTGADINSAFCGIFPETCFDSFLTIGRANSSSPGNAITVLTSPAGLFDPTFGNGFPVGIPCTVNDGAWFALNGDVNGLPTGVDNRVLLMQVTCPTGELEYQINVQVFDNGVGANSLYYAHNLQGPMGIVGGVLEQDFTCEGLVWPEPAACLAVPGCTDVLACNFNPLATVDNGTCTYPGCTDPLACNFNAAAGCSNGSCTYPGCTNALACNFNALAGCDNGSCTFPGCTDPLACNFSAAAGCSNGSCTYPGCTNALACNYNALAGCDNGSCTFPGCNDITACNYDMTAGCDDGSCCLSNCVNLNLSSGSFASEVSWTLTDGLGVIVANGGAPTNIDLCLVDDCYVFNMFDNFADGWNGATYTFTINGIPSYAGTLPSGATGSANIGIPGQCGCTDPTACNYDVNAVVDNGSCSYAVANDLCANAVALGSATTTISVDNTAACQNEGVVVPGTGCNVTNGWCVGAGAEETSVWYTFTTPAANAQVTITTFDNGSGFVDTQIAVYSGGCGGTLVAANDDGNPPGFMSELIFACGALAPSTTYTLLVDGYFGDTGVFGLDLIIDQAICVLPIPGCTDVNACNFNPGANVDDGSCCYDNCVNITVTTGTFPGEISWTFTDGLGNTVASGGATSSTNLCIGDDCYSFNAFDSFGDGWNGATFTITVNGVATYSGAPTGSGGVTPATIGLTSGCTNPGACNYDAAAGCDNGTCEFLSCTGCTDVAACNYDAAAILDDGTCCYGICTTIDMFDGFGDGWDNGTWTITDYLGNFVASGSLPSGSFGSADICLTTGCYIINVGGSTFDSEISWTLNGTDGGAISGGSPSSTQFGIGGAGCFGCTNVGACNYSGTAVFDDGSCEFISCAGCTNPTACNYDMNATIDDGSCVYPGCTDPAACNYNALAGCDDGSCIAAGCTDPTACNYDALAGCNDGSCTYPPCIGNDVPSGATALMVTPLGTCNPMMDDLTGASDSPESSAVGPDLWYAITAVTPGLRIQVVDVNPQDLKIDLLDAFLNPVDAENVVAGNGGEILNYGDLTSGATYYIAVSGSTGQFSICAQWIQDSQCDYGPGPYDLCATFKSNWIGAAGYAFEFTSLSTLITYSYEKAAALQPSTFLKLNDVVGLTWNDSYSVNSLAFYNLTNGIGIEKVYVNSDNICTITVNPAPTMILRPSDNCANFGPHLLGQTIAGQPFVCSAINYEWEFTRTDVAELPIYKLRGAPNRFLHLLTVPGLVAGGVYDVRVRPIFSYGVGAWGAPSCLSIVGVVIMDTQDGPVNDISMNEERVDVTGMEAGLYPNPNSGSMININLTGVTSETVNVDVRDQVGRMVYSVQYTVNDGSLQGVITFDSQLAGGMYTMTFTMDGESRTEKFMVTR